MKTECIQEWQVNCTAEEGQIKLPAEECIDRLVYLEKHKRCWGLERELEVRGCRRNIYMFKVAIKKCIKTSSCPQVWTFFLNRKREVFILMKVKQITNSGTPHIQKKTVEAKAYDHENMNDRTSQLLFAAQLQNKIILSNLFLSKYPQGDNCNIWLEGVFLEKLSSLERILAGLDKEVPSEKAGLPAIPKQSQPFIQDLLKYSQSLVIFSVFTLK